MIRNFSISSYLQNQPPKNYKYKRLSLSESEDESRSNNQKENLELQTRETKTNLGKTDTGSSLKLQHYDRIVDRPIQKGESLTSISLMYRISVAELKRVNRLEKEVEFYALNSLKIPVRANSLLHELLEEEGLNENKSSDPNGSISLEQKQSSGSEFEGELDMPTGVISINQICREKETRREAKQFLINMQKDLQKFKQKTNSRKASLGEATTSLTNVAFSSPMKKKFSFSDLDLTWWKILLIGAVILIGAPSIYLFLVSFD